MVKPKKILMDNSKILNAMSQALLDVETISHDDIKNIVEANRPNAS